MAAKTAWRSRIVGSGEEDPAQLTANPRNWRIHPKAQQDALAGSLDQVGWVQQVMVNRTTGNIVDGHARVEQALSRGEATVPVLYVELTEAEEGLVLASLDPIGAMAGRDDEKLRQLLAEVSFDSEALAASLDALLPSTPKAGLTDPDDVPDDADASNVKRGDLFALGDHRLMCGDSTTDLPRLVDGERADCVWTDPPYGVSYVGKTKDALTIQNDGPAADALVLDVFAACRSAVVDGAPFYCAGPAGPLSLNFQLAIVASGFRIHEELVWVKDVMVLGHSDYHYRHEPVFYGYAPGPGRPGRGAHEGTRWYGDHAQTSVLEFDRPKRSEEHPTMKPVALVASMIANSTPKMGIVLEPFAGSGSTIIAAEQLGRRCYAMEIDPRYVAVAIKRWEDFTGRTAERLA